MLSSEVFRRETASGFYPWGKVEGPRKRVAEGLCGWRHGNSFPMTQSAQSHRQMRSIPRCSKAVFYVFVFLIPFTIRQQCRIYPQKFSTNFLLSTEKGGRGWSPFWIGIGMLVLLLWCALDYKIPCSGVISRPAASTSCRSFFITSAGIHLRSTLTVRTRLRLRTMSIGA